MRLASSTLRPDLVRSESVSERKRTRTPIDGVRARHEQRTAGTSLSHRDPRRVGQPGSTDQRREDRSWVNRRPRARPSLGSKGVLVVAVVKDSPAERFYSHLLTWLRLARGRRCGGRLHRQRRFAFPRFAEADAAVSAVGPRGLKRLSAGGTNAGEGHTALGAERVLPTREGVARTTRLENGIAQDEIDDKPDALWHHSDQKGPEHVS